MEITFKKTVSKGSRFNQIYIPKAMEDAISVGDEVEVRLIKKQVQLHYAKGLKKLSGFKEKLINDVFSFLQSHFTLKAMFVVGSFLTETVDYHDIDIVLIAEKQHLPLEEKVYTQLIGCFNLKFHVLCIEAERFQALLAICPLTRAMFSLYVGNTPFTLPQETAIDKQHIQFLLMMPHDLLEIKVSGRVFYDTLRRLYSIKRFLQHKPLLMTAIHQELKKDFSQKLLSNLKDNEPLDDFSLSLIRKAIKKQLIKIEAMLSHG